MEAWRTVWRNGFSKFLPIEGLKALLTALQTDDPRLKQGCTTTPPPLMCVTDWPCENGCAVAFSGWMGEKLTTVGEVSDFFDRACFESDQLTGKPADCRWFLNYFDDTPRDTLRRELIPEVAMAIASRTVPTVPASPVMMGVPPAGIS